MLAAPKRESSRSRLVRDLTMPVEALPIRLKALRLGAIGYDAARLVDVRYRARPVPESGSILDIDARYLEDRLANVANGRWQNLLGGGAS